MAFFTPFTFVKLSRFYSITVLFAKNKKLWNEGKKRVFAYIAVSAYHLISKEEENPSLDTTEFLDTYVYLNNPH